MTTCRPSNFSKKNTMSNWQRMRGLVSWELREPWKHEGAAHVSFGSQAEVERGLACVCISPGSGPRASGFACRLRANSSPSSRSLAH